MNILYYLNFFLINSVFSEPHSIRKFTHSPFQIKDYFPIQKIESIQQKSTFALDKFSLSFWVKHENFLVSNNYFSLLVDDTLHIKGIYFPTGLNLITLNPLVGEPIWADLIHSIDQNLSKWVFISIKFEISGGKFTTTMGVSSTNRLMEKTTTPSFEKITIIFYDSDNTSNTCERYFF